MAKHAYITCDHCKQDFKSMTMIPEGANVPASAPKVDCPHCGKATTLSKLSWKEPSGK